MNTETVTKRMTIENETKYQTELGLYMTCRSPSGGSKEVKYSFPENSDIKLTTNNWNGSSWLLCLLSLDSSAAFDVGLLDHIVFYWHVPIYIDYILNIWQSAELDFSISAGPLVLRIVVSGNEYVTNNYYLKGCDTGFNFWPHSVCTVCNTLNAIYI